MAYRPTWQGHLKLSLVTCPVALYTGVSSGSEVRFNLINPKTNNRIKMVTTDPDTGPVSRSDLVKGYEVEKGRFILMTEDEIKSVRLESTKTIEIERFVPGAERLLALEPRGKGIVAHSLRTVSEVRDSEEIFQNIADIPPDPGMIAIAKQIIKQAEGPFDPTQFVDRYEEALKGLIADKLKGCVPVGVAEPHDTEVIDLMAALKASLQGAASKQPPGKTKESRSASVTPITKGRARRREAG
jgi:DNA end-binding protein Ku